jgi:hypothetical protein
MGRVESGYAREMRYAWMNAGSLARLSSIPTSDRKLSNIIYCTPSSLSRSKPPKSSPRPHKHHCPSSSHPDQHHPQTLPLCDTFTTTHHQPFHTVEWPVLQITELVQLYEECYAYEVLVAKRFGLAKRAADIDLENVLWDVDLDALGWRWEQVHGGQEWVAE